MDLTAVAVVALGFLLFGLASRRLAGSFVTGPLLFSAFGLIAGPAGLGLVELQASNEFIHTLAEITLIVVLFADAASIDLERLRKDHVLPLRLLAIGMPLGILMTTLCALTLFEALSLWEAALLAAILAPTDAALGQAVVSSNLVPTRIRQTLNVESGLNDGIALPLVLVFASLASAMEAGPEFTDWIVFGLTQVTLGPLAGVAVGVLGGLAVKRAYAMNWMSEQAEGIIALAIALLAFATAEILHGNGFIAAFVAGLCFGYTLEHRCQFLYEFAEAEGLFLILMTFFVFGGVMLPTALPNMDLAYVIMAVLSLTVLRMLPVWFSLLATGTSPRTAAFLGWFGPRGLASVLFVLLILEELDMGGQEIIYTAALTTVMLSVVLHGMTAGPGARGFAAVVAQESRGYGGGTE